MAADGHLGITALSRVTLASAGLSCYVYLGQVREIKVMMALRAETYSAPRL